MRTILRPALEPVGEWRSSLVWRGFGVFINQMAIRLSTQSGWPPPGMLLLHACGLLLILFGPRLVILIATTGAAAGFFVHLLADSRYQIAEEYGLMVLLPLLGSLFAAAVIGGPGRQRPGLSSRLDAAQISLFRVSALIFMFFAAFHKLNIDFFNPEISCAFLPTHGRFEEFQSSKELLAQAVPYFGFLGEAGVSVLLFFYPRIGIPFTAIIMGVVGHAGATPLCTLVVIMSLAFLRPNDRAICVDGWRRFWPASVAVLGVLPALSLLLLLRGKSGLTWHEYSLTWLEYALFEVLIGAILLSSAHVLIAEIKKRWGVHQPRSAALRELLRPALRSNPVLPDIPWIRRVLLCIILVGVLNGLAPYSGLKYRLSSAMFSNLRVDEERWNSLIVPRWFYLRQHDPFVHVTRAVVDRPSVKNLDPQRIVSEGLFTSGELLRRLEYMHGRLLKTELKLSYAGESREYRNATFHPDLRSWLASIDENERFLQSALTLDQPQPCVH